MARIDAIQLYHSAVKAGQKYYAAQTAQRKSSNLEILDGLHAS